jgi:voltage-gated potassium channel
LLLLPFSRDQKQIVIYVDVAIGVFFLFDFLVRLIRAPTRRSYVIRRHGWLDLIAGIPVPGFRIAKAIQIAETGRQMRRRGVGAVVARASGELAGNTLLVAVLATLVTVQAGSMLIVSSELYAERSTITSAGDALWWSYVTVTTVGYGDEYPVTNRGRAVGYLMLSLGVVLFAVITGFFANAFINPKKAREAEAQQRQAAIAQLGEMQESLALLRTEVATLTEEVRRDRQTDRASEG